MASLSSYYNLCPLIDQQNLLGVEADSNPGCAIVTLGRNIVIRYKLQDLKQVSSWSSKERLTTQVIYDSISKNYVAIFNGKNIKIWQEQETNLDNVKKYKLLSPIYTILTCTDIPPILVMQNGNTISLEEGLKNRKTWNNPGILASNEKISSCQLICVKDKIYLCALTKLEHIYNYIVVPLKKENFTVESDQLVRIELKRSSEKLVGHVILQDKNNAFLLTLWSLGRLYSYSLINPSMESSPGSLISVVTVVNTKHQVVMTALNENTIAAYGADAHEEGAVIIIYNVQFKLVQAVQKLKLFTEDAKLWKIDDKLLLAANRYLAVAPYSLAAQRIDLMLGSSLQCKNNNSDDNDIVEIEESIVANWGSETLTNKNEIEENKPKSHIAAQFSALVQEGKSDAAICHILIPQLIKSNDIFSIVWCLTNVKDVPAELLVNLLSFCLKNNLSKKEQDEFLNKILNIKVSNICLIQNLRKGLSLDEALKLLNYLTDKLSYKDPLLSDSTTNSGCTLDNQICEWINLLFDSFYPLFVQSQDEQILKQCTKLIEVSEVHVDSLKNFINLENMIEALVDGNLLESSATNSNNLDRFYSIEEIKLY